MKQPPDDPRAKWCVHYKRAPGMPKREACKAGIVYDDLAKVDEMGRNRGCSPFTG